LLKEAAVDFDEALTYDWPI